MKLKSDFQLRYSKSLRKDKAKSPKTKDGYFIDDESFLQTKSPDTNNTCGTINSVRKKIDGELTLSVVIYIHIYIDIYIPVEVSCHSQIWISGLVIHFLNRIIQETGMHLFWGF